MDDTKPLDEYSTLEDWTLNTPAWRPFVPHYSHSTPRTQEVAGAVPEWAH